MDILQRLYRIARSQTADVLPPVDSFIEPEIEQDAPPPRQAPPPDSELARSYANLEIPYGSDLQVAQKAWRRLLKQYHPDLHATDPQKRQVADTLTAELTAAFRYIEKSIKDKEKG
jgi:DnaJ-class molecular chaperone